TREFASFAWDTTADAVAGWGKSAWDWFYANANTIGDVFDILDYGFRILQQLMKDPDFQRRLGWLGRKVLPRLLPKPVPGLGVISLFFDGIEAIQWLRKLMQPKPPGAGPGAGPGGGPGAGPGGGPGAGTPPPPPAPWVVSTTSESVVNAW